MLKAPEDTIAAISTPPGEGGIGIVRLSGSRAIPVVRGIFVSSTRRDIAQDPGRVFLGRIVDARGHTVDEALVHVMRLPHSYTREDVVEINCHGGAGPLNAVLEVVLAQGGVRLARPGEFTQRAFVNGRIDLVQAEAVIDRIRAGTRDGLRAAATAAAGVLSQAIGELKGVLVEALARIEAAVDFPDEDLPDLVDQALRANLEAARERMGALLDTARTGRLYREGAGVTIVGRPNVGKSCLFNALLRDARAIVSALPGTTRDRIEETITLSGIPVRLTDTAGLRTTHDEVEQIGIDIARGALRAADIVLLVLDASEPLTAEDLTVMDELRASDTPVWIAFNKTDLALKTPPPPETDGFAGLTPLSAQTTDGLHRLEDGLAGLLLGGGAPSPEQLMLTRAHQRDSVRRAADALDRLLANFDASPEFLSIDLREAIAALGEITGETTPDDVLERIFSSFCIGK